MKKNKLLLPLLGICCICLTIGIFSACKQVKEHIDKIYYELVFENETNIITVEDWQAEIDSGLYTKVKSFFFDNDAPIITLPDVYIRTVKLATGAITYEQVDTDDLVFTNQDQVYVIGNQIFPMDRSAPVIDNRIYIRVDSADKNIAELYLPIRVLKEPILVESLTLFTYDNSDSVELTESKYLVVGINPMNASYQNYEYQIEKIVKPDGTVYQDDLSQYAYIENGELFTTKDIQIGSEIYISAQTIPNEFVPTAVKSNVLVIEVTRIAIEDIIFSDPYRRGDINLGETITLGISIYPENATINILRDSVITVSLNDESIAELVKLDDRTYTLTASDEYTDLNKNIELTLCTENYIGKYTYRISSIPIQTMAIYDKETGKELADETELYRTDTLELKTVITPVNATVDKISYNLYSETPNLGAYVSISEEGILTVTDFAPFNLVFYLSATANNSTTKGYKITIVSDLSNCFSLKWI